MNEPDFRNVFQAVKLFADYDRPWAVCGGWAVDLYLGRVTRTHKDVDFVVFQSDQLLIQEYLSSRGWRLEKAFDGKVVPWQMGEWINLPVHIIWCKNPNCSPDFVELLFDEADEANFYFRRDPSITLPLEKMIVSSASGIPILAPEIVLLYKSALAEDQSYAEDFRNLLPALHSEARNWFADALEKMYPGHIWLKSLT